MRIENYPCVSLCSHYLLRVPLMTMCLLEITSGTKMPIILVNFPFKILHSLLSADAAIASTSFIFGLEIHETRVNYH